MPNVTITVNPLIIIAIVGFLVNLAALLGIYYKLAVMTYQHRLMWADYIIRKGIAEVTEKTA